MDYRKVFDDDANRDTGLVVDYPKTILNSNKSNSCSPI